MSCQISIDKHSKNAKKKKKSENGLKKRGKEVNI